MKLMIKSINNSENYLEYSLSKIIIYLNMINIMNNFLNKLLKLWNNNKKLFKNFMIIINIMNKILYFKI